MKKYSIGIACLAAALLAQPAGAHPADLYYQVVAARLDPAGMQITWDVLPGVILAQVAWLEADLDQDGAVSGGEARAWGQSALDEFELSLNGGPLEVRLESVEWPSALTDIQNNNVPIRLYARADWPGEINAAQELVLRDGYNASNSLTLFRVQSGDGVMFEAPDQGDGTLRLRVGTPGAAPGAEWMTSWESARPSIPGLVQALGLGEVAEQAAQAVPQKQGMSAVLEGLLRGREVSPWFVPAALALAAVVGALHALTPGHGKTVVAAYLIGSRGTLRHAVFLGGIVTLTHTGSVFLLGLVTLAASEYILPSSLFPVLEILSGVLIVGLGAGLLVQRVRAWKNGGSRSIKVLNTKDAKEHKGKTFVKTQGHAHTHGEGEHLHEGGHTHEHDLPDPSGINLRTLAALGVSGGLVPCPEAIAILLLAVSLGRILLGLSLILAFSLGLAFILIAIGMVMVQSKSLFARLGILDRWARAIPVVSAGVVLALGLGLTFGALNNARALAGTRVPAAQAGPAFDPARARVLFAAPDGNNRNQLHLVPAAGGQAQRITHEPQGVREYTVVPDGTWLAYSAADESGGSNLWRLDTATLQTTRLLACPAALCGRLILSQDGARGLYSRLDLETMETGLGIPSVWWLDLPGGETGPVFPEADIPALNFDWSPRGTWLSYTSGLTPEIRIDNLQTGRGYTLSTRTGGRLAWSPREESFLLVDLRAAGPESVHQVIRIPAGESEGAPLIDSLDFNEYDAVWSPDGEWIALVRAAVQPAAGDAIWLVRPDGSQAHAVTTDADALHGRPVWSPDGKHLLFTYSGIGDPQPRIRMLDLDSGATRDLSANGTQPAWLP